MNNIGHLCCVFTDRALGKTGVMVMRHGAGRRGGDAAASCPDHNPAALAEAALDLGITYFDTAPAYNQGQSETNYGEVVARRRGEIFLATKTGDRTYDGTLRSVEEIA